MVRPVEIYEAPVELEFDKVLTKSLNKACPVFGKTSEKSCPFSNLLATKKNLLKRCPSFRPEREQEKEEVACPFKSCESMADVWKMLGQVPPSHRPMEEVETKNPEDENNTKANELFAYVLREMHSVSLREKTVHGDCPKFSMACPFKTLTPREEEEIPLISEYEWRTWPGLVLEDDDDGDHHGSHKDLPLSKMMKERTKKMHHIASTLPYVRALIKGKVPPNRYRGFVARLYHVYETLEGEFRRLCTENGDNEEFKEEREKLRTLWFPEHLERLDALKEDLQYFYGDDWRESEDIQVMSPATKAYVERMRKVAREDPLLLIAHSYSRYLGDLSGGKTLQRVLKRTWNLPESGAGRKFYFFDLVKSSKDFKNMYRERMDALQVSKDLCEALVEESIMAYQFNIDLFHEMGDLNNLARPMDVTDTSTSSLNQSANITSGTNKAKCPFAQILTEPNETSTGTGKAGAQAGKCPFSAKDPITQIQYVLVALILAIVAAFLFGIDI